MPIFTNLNLRDIYKNFLRLLFLSEKKHNCHLTIKTFNVSALKWIWRVPIKIYVKCGPCVAYIRKTEKCFNDKSHVFVFKYNHFYVTLAELTPNI